MMKRIPVTISLLLLCVNVWVLAEERVSGTIAGQTWSKAKSPYLVIGDIKVASLNIEPGVSVVFTGNYAFEITGVLRAIGSAQDSILFTTTVADSGWGGIFFNQVPPGSELSFCKIEHSRNSGIRLHDASPMSSNLVIKNCLIQKNTAPTKGGGIYAIGLLSLVQCTILDNSISSRIYPGTAEHMGGGIYVEGSLKMDDCTVASNYLYIYGKHVTSLGGGVYVKGSAKFSGCRLFDNRASVYAAGTFFQGVYSRGSGRAEGGGVFVNGSQCIFINCLVAQDSSIVTRYNGVDLETIGGGGIYADCDNVTITNCTIAFNDNEGLKSTRGTTQTVNAIFYFNSAQQIAGSATASYCNIQGGRSGEGNIAFNPNFILDRKNFRLAAGSPCIDKGKPDTTGLNLPPLDLEGQPRIVDGDKNGSTIIDMGCYEFPGRVSVESRDVFNPKVFQLHQNHPNPFNPSTTISFDLPRASEVTLKIFDLVGHEVATLAEQKMQAGRYSFKWDASGMPGGVYFYRLQTEAFTQTRKLLLLR
jgi:predicted outer membrane repeat protein